MASVVTDRDAHELWPVYDAVFGDQVDERTWRSQVWDRHAARAGFLLARAYVESPDGGPQLVGFGYGYTGERGQWWTDRATTAGLAVRTLLSRSADPATTWHAPRPGLIPAPAPSNETSTTPGGRRRTDRRIDRAVTVLEGAALVTDPDALRATLLTGIGRSKSYGCGLLSLAPARQGA